MREVARKSEVGLVAAPWTSAILGDLYEELRTLAQGERLDLPADDAVRSGLVGIRVRGAGYTADSPMAPTIATLVSLLRAPPRPLPLTAQEEEDAFKVQFLTDLEKARKRLLRLGPLPVTHSKFRRT